MGRGGRGEEGEREVRGDVGEGEGVCACRCAGAVCTVATATVAMRLQGASVSICLGVCGQGDTPVQQYPSPRVHPRQMLTKKILR